MFDFLVLGTLSQTVLVGITVGLAVYWFLQNRKYNMPPGPLNLPLLGNLLQLPSDRRYHFKFYEWSKKYGPVITVGLGPTKAVVVNNLETAMEVLVKKSEDFAGRKPLTSSNVLTKGVAALGMSNYGPILKLHRKITSKALRHFMQGDALEQRIHTALRTICPVLESMGEAFEPDNALGFLMGNIVVGLLFNGKYEYGNRLVSSLCRLNDELFTVYNSCIPEDLFPPLRFIYTSKSMKTVHEFRNVLIDDFIRNNFYEQKKTFNKETTRNLADALLLARLEAQESDEEIVDCLKDENLILLLTELFLGGFSSSRATLKFAILHMMAFPDIQEKVQQEIDREVGKDRLPGMEDRLNLGYTEAVLNESMRYATLGPSGFPHSTTTDTDIAGYKIPKDTLVIINNWALNNDPGAWEEAEKFKPERFLDENGRLGLKPPNFLPFAAGKRACLGEFVAKPQLHLLFAGLMQKFTWKAESGVNLDLTPGGTFFGATAPPFKVIVERRI